ncbi:MAG: heparinase II/III family protein [Deltaproteobacteria bacterium]|nr:heparinase II/III family protein [Deltaproteobacteria bacterium]
MRRARAWLLALAALVAVVAIALAVKTRLDRGPSARPRSAGSSAPKPTRLDGMVVRAEHPRIWLDPDRVRWLKEKAKGKTAPELVAAAGPTPPAHALASLATDDPAPCHAAFSAPRPANAPVYHLALLYDWCHAHLSNDEKAKLRGLLVPAMEEEMKSARAWRSFHNAAHTAALNLTLAALAFHGDDPIGERALAFLRPELDDMLSVFEELFPDGEWAEGTDYARHASHHGLRVFLALKTATNIDLVTSSKHFRNIASYVFYATKPNGLMFPGDDDDYPYLSGWEHMALLASASAFRDPHAQWFLRHATRESFALPDRDRWTELLWRDDAIPERPLDDLPLARLFRGKGLVLARSGWGFGTSDAWLAFSNGDYYGDHLHYDVNAFQISRGNGDLAIDSGRYDDDWDAVGKPAKVARSQFFNYYQRTIAHNTMLVFDPKESFPKGLLNDGGQRWLLARGKDRNVPEDWAQGSFPSDDGIGTCDWTTNPGRWERGDIVAYEATPDFVYVRGDGTKAYAPEKLSSFVRDLLFVRGASPSSSSLVVVIDRVVSTNASFAKTWLLHTIDEPRLAPDGSWFEVVDGDSRLFGVPLLPDPRRLVKVGGPGDEFRVGSTRFKAGLASEVAPSALHEGERPGAWRIEEQPATAQLEDWFVNVMLLGPRTSEERPRIDVIARDAAILAFRVHLDDGTTTTLRIDRREGATKSPPSLVIARGGKTVIDRPLASALVP